MDGWTNRCATAISHVLNQPPSHAAGFRSDDLDEIHEFVARYDGNHRRAALGSGPLGYSAHVVRCGEVDLAWACTGMRQKVTGIPQSPILHLPLRRRHVYASGARTLEATPDRAILLEAGQEYTVYSEPDDCTNVVRLPAAAFARELLHRDPASVHARQEMRAIPLGGSRLSAFATMQRALVEATHPMTPQAARPATGHLAARLCSWMAECVLGARPGSATPGLGIQRIRSVEAWIDAHLTTPITLGRLCAVAGVGDRWLESAFWSHRGQSPLQFVMSRRLAWVRRGLLDPKPGDTVTQLAHDAGFVHLGRFAARYRSAYGEPPSETLRRSLNRH